MSTTCAGGRRPVLTKAAAEPPVVAADKPAQLDKPAARKGGLGKEGKEGKADKEAHFRSRRAALG